MLIEGRVKIVAALFVLAGACGGSSPPPAATTASFAAVSTAWHRYAQCVRDHGVPDEPDPTVDDHGRVTFPDSAPRLPDAVVQQCASNLDGVPTQPPAAVDVATRTRFAQCMRQQGISDFPDPDSQGRFQLPPSLDQGGNLKSSARWPQVQRAMNGPCKQYDPSGHI
jgi:hypothetical protein